MGPAADPWDDQLPVLFYANLVENQPALPTVQRTDRHPALPNEAAEQVPVLPADLYLMSFYLGVWILVMDLLG
jgi:hypothetical protein